MAIIEGPLLGFVTGRLGPVMLRHVWGKTVMQPIPLYSKRKKITERQKAHRKRFAEASNKAKAIRRDPIQRKIWKAKCQHDRVFHDYLVEEMMKLSENRDE